MKFTKLNINNWKRKEYFEHYFNNVPCTYSMTVKLDITNIIKNKLKLYPTMIYYLTMLVNRYDEFKTCLNNEGELGIYDEMIPCYTIFHKESQTFSNVWTNYTADYREFIELYNQGLMMYRDNLKMMAKPHLPQNSFPISMIPWTTFEGFNLNLQKGYDYLLPIFTMGKYYHDHDKIILPLAIQVHHAVCDGYHLCRFINELQDEIDKMNIL